MNQETREGPTPGGGVYSTAFYQDADGKPADKGVATKVMIVEYGPNDEPIRRTYGELNRVRE